MFVSPLDSPREAWLLVHEPRPRWAASLRAALARAKRPEDAARVRSLVELPSLATLQRIDLPTVIAFELNTRNASEQLRRMADLRNARKLCTVGLIDSSLDAARVSLAALEAGATLTIDSPRAVEPLTRLADRHAVHGWRQLRAELPPHEFLRRRLPWQPAPWELSWLV